jgi:5-methylcytosine-specific restriction endonuclease McrA
MSVSPPTPEEQIGFLRNVQRLLAEGLFVASDKFALLHALADLVVTKGDDTGAALTLGTEEVAEKFIELYWQQGRPLQVGGTGTGLVLRQNTGKQAAVIKNIIFAQNQCSGSLSRLRQSDPERWKRLVAGVSQTLCTMPLWKLQTVGSERLDFLYDNVGHGTTITLKPGVAFCLRAFYGLLRERIQAAWTRFVQRLNAEHFGNLTDLGTFRFGRERGALEVYRPILMDLQRGFCFYCGGVLHRQAEVDHFIPWSRYPTDLGHNFVLAHPRCNGSKSDHLAAEEHLGAWVERNEVHREALGAFLADATIQHDLAASVRVAEWAYDQTERSRGQVWVRDQLLRHLGSDWREILRV